VGAPTPVPASAYAQRHPDRRTAWVIVVLAHLDHVCPSTDELDHRLRWAATTYPLLGARLHGSWWYPGGEPPTVSAVTDGDPLHDAPVHHFALDREPPLRVRAAADGSWLMLCAHHFAFDGLSMVALLRTLLTGEQSSALDHARVSASRQPRSAALRRLAFPAQPVAPSVDPPSRESFVHRSAWLGGRGVTARLAGACTAAITAHNAGRRQPCRRIGISVAVGGVGGEAATYRRIDVTRGESVESRVETALREPAVPRELVHVPRWAGLARPVLPRLSDTCLVSNLGRCEVPGASRLEFYPVARGRSAVAFGAAGLQGRPATLTVRARNLDQHDAAILLDRVVDKLHGST
jgi:hypothetical protein